MKKTFKVLGIVIAMSFCFILFSCAKNNSENESTKIIPIYEGMTISRKTTINALGSTDLINVSGVLDKKEKLEKKIEDIVTLEVDNDDEVKYFVSKGEKFTINIHLSNPSNFKIDSFILNEEKYDNKKFIEGSKDAKQFLSLDVTAPTESGYIDFKIKDIKYIDDAEVKEAKMDGKKDVKVGIKHDFAPTITSFESIVETTSVNFKFTANDVLNLARDNTFKMYLSNGEEIVASKDVESGSNDITFDNLYASKTYEYGILSVYDILDGQGFQKNWLLTDTFSTLEAFSFKDVTATTSIISFDINKYLSTGIIKEINLLDNSEKIDSIKNEDIYQFTDLLSNHNYVIELKFAYENDDKLVEEVIEYKVSTLAKKVPTVKLDEVESTETSISFNLGIQDVDLLLKVEKIELILANEVISEITEITDQKFTFNELLTNNGYVIKVSYLYNLNDGKGKQEKTIEVTKNTVSKPDPVLNIYIIPNTANKKINFDLRIDEKGSRITVESIELYSNDIFVAKLDNFKIEGNVFTNLFTDTLYTIKVTYSYDLNDGKGKQEKIATASRHTLKFAPPTLEIVEIYQTNLGVIFDIELTNYHYANLLIEKIELLNGNDVVEVIDDSLINNFTSYLFQDIDLLSSGEYAIKVTYSCDMEDGKGRQKIEEFEKIIINPDFKIRSFEITGENYSSNGETIILEAEISNPLNAKIKSVIINSIEYNVSDFSTEDKMVVAILNDGQFLGGDITLDIETVFIIVDEITYVINVEGIESPTIFINGDISINDFYFVDSHLNRIDYSNSSNTQLYYYLAINNPTGYKITKFELKEWSGGDFSTVYEINDDNYLGDNKYYFEINMEKKWDQIRYVKLYYSNEYLEGTFESDETLAIHERIFTDEIVEIRNVDDLKNMSGENHYKLMNDIDLSGENWNPVDFNGIFDGNNFKILNLSLEGTFYDTDLYIGLFKNAKGYIFDLTVSNASYNVVLDSTNDKKQYKIVYGTIAVAEGYYQKFNIDNCHVKDSTINLTNNTEGSITAGIVLSSSISTVVSNCSSTGSTITTITETSTYGYNKVGGITPSAFQISNCYNTSTINIVMNNNSDIDFGYYPSTSCNVGGVVAHMNGGATASITNCYNAGTINIESGSRFCDIGGVVGTTYSHSSIIKDCYNSGKITFERTSAIGEGVDSIGGILGTTYEYITIYNCYNAGEIDVKYDENILIGGIIGSLFNNYNFYPHVVINKCYNIGTITATAILGKHPTGGYLGGIAGYVSKIINCYNEGLIIINGNLHTGGIAGSVDEVSNCYNIGEINGEHSYFIGGIAGDALNIQNCYNAGKITLDGGELAGAIAGSVYYGKASKCLFLETGGLETYTDSQYIRQCIYYDGTYDFKKCLINSLNWSTEIWNFDILDLENNIHPTFN